MLKLLANAMHGFILGLSAGIPVEWRPGIAAQCYCLETIEFGELLDSGLSDLASRLKAQLVNRAQVISGSLLESGEFGSLLHQEAVLAEYQWVSLVVDSAAGS